MVQEHSVKLHNHLVSVFCTLPPSADQADGVYEEISGDLRLLDALHNVGMPSVS